MPESKAAPVTHRGPPRDSGRTRRDASGGRVQKIAGSASARRLGNLRKARITHPLLLKHLPQRLARVVLPL